MKWQAKEIDLYLQAKEYVDTAIIPLIPISWDSDVKATVQKGEFIILLSDDLERQFRGRVFQFPPYTYLKNEPLDEHLRKMNNLIEHLRCNGFDHILFLTSEVAWKQREQDLNNALLWVSSIMLEQLDQKHKTEILSNQMKQIIPMLTNEWRKIQNGDR